MWEKERGEGHNVLDSDIASSYKGDKMWFSITIHSHSVLQLHSYRDYSFYAAA